MTWEFEPDEGEEVKDRTYLWWLLIGIIVVAGIGYLALNSDGESNVSRVRIRHIMIAYDSARPNTKDNAMERITELRERVLRGENFAKLAKNYSHDANSKDRGGDMGWQYKGDLPESLEPFAWSAQINTVSKILESSEAFHIAIVVDRELGINDRYELKLKNRSGN